MMKKHYNDKCDIDPKTLKFKRHFSAGEAVKICAECYNKILENPDNRGRPISHLRMVK